MTARAAAGSALQGSARRIQATVPASAAARASTISSRFAAIIGERVLEVRRLALAAFLAQFLQQPVAAIGQQPRHGDQVEVGVEFLANAALGVRPWNSSTAIMVLDVL